MDCKRLMNLGRQAAASPMEIDVPAEHRGPGNEKLGQARKGSDSVWFRCTQFEGAPDSGPRAVFAGFPSGGGLRRPDRRLRTWRMATGINPVNVTRSRMAAAVP